MNYNKLFIISLSLIYSANVFSNTDSPSPNMGNSLESNQEINASIIIWILKRKNM